MKPKFLNILCSAVHKRSTHKLVYIFTNIFLQYLDIKILRPSNKALSNKALIVGLKISVHKNS